MYTSTEAVINAQLISKFGFQEVPSIYEIRPPSKGRRALKKERRVCISMFKTDFYCLRYFLDGA